MKLPSKITTDRLIIRKFEQRDLPAFLEFMLDKDSTKYLNFTPEQVTKQGASSLLQWVINSYSTEEPIFSMALECRETGRYIGSAGFAPYGGAGCFECYYSINKGNLKRGLAKEAMSALIRYLSEQGVPTLYAFNHPDNVASEKLALSLGFKYSGMVKREDLPSSAKAFKMNLSK